MARNIEIKARIPDMHVLQERASLLSGARPEIIHQEDIFFKCDEGRLKLRILSPDSGQLIFYQRADQKGPKTSNYYITETREPSSLLDVLDRSYGKTGVVRKTRYLYLVDNTRIHIDRVEDLGDFLELEVVLNGNDDVGSGREEAYRLMDGLGIEQSSLVEGAYIDLLMQRRV
jgi:predicted adenylyl cyclase CyaB